MDGRKNFLFQVVLQFSSSQSRLKSFIVLQFAKPQENHLLVRRSVYELFIPNTKGVSSKIKMLLMQKVFPLAKQF